MQKTSKEVDCDYAITGGKINTKVLHSMIYNGYSKKPKEIDNIDGYVLDKSLSGTRAQVYHNPETNHLVVNHRGTQGIHDVITDFRLMLGDKSNQRFKHGKKITDEAIKKYNTNNVTIAGHSLGSAVAKEAAKEHNVETIGVNPAVVPTDLLKKQGEKDYVVKSSLDPVSILHGLKPGKTEKNTKTVRAKSYNPLTEHSSDVLNRLDPNSDIGA